MNAGEEGRGEVGGEESGNGTGVEAATKEKHIVGYIGNSVVLFIFSGKCNQKYTRKKIISENANSTNKCVLKGNKNLKKHSN